MLFNKKKEKASESVRPDERLRHIAFIMDGNGRWAQAKGMPREYGHSHGAATFRRIGRYCKSIGLKYMTVYAFSTENWKRPQKEVDTIMHILESYIDECLQTMAEDHVHVRFIGNLSVLSSSLQEKMQKIDACTSHNPFLLNIAVNYGGREEILHACNALLQKGIETVDEDTFAAHLYTAGCPDPDLVVRTGGDLRISNFLLWQSAYTEYYFSSVLWPDLSEKDVDEAISAFYARKRRYGGV